jgi:hypothetical protein
MPTLSSDVLTLARSTQQVPALGIGWRSPHYAELLQRLPKLDFLEVHSENFFGAGGASLAVLEQGASPLSGQPAWRRLVTWFGRWPGPMAS